MFKSWKIGDKTYKAGQEIVVTSAMANEKGQVIVTAQWGKKASSDLDYVPAAGDNFPVLLWAGMILFGAIALVETVSTRKKRS